MTGQQTAPNAENTLSRGALGTADITFMVIAVAAPMAVVVATMPLAFALGNGPGVPGTYFLAAVTLALFAVGYVRLLPHIPNAGAFYAIIASAFGRTLGLAAAYVATVCYISLCCAGIGAFSFFAADFCLRVSGAAVNWGVFAFATIAALAILSYFRITITATILAIALTAEVVAILMVDVAILLTRGISALDIGAFSPSHVFTPGIGIAAIYAYNSCIGFEGTAIYQEEARDRARSVPRATYIAIAVVGVFYVFTALCLQASVGSERIVDVAGHDPGHFVFGAAHAFVGGWAEDLLSVLVLTSGFASALGLFNNCTRYLFALARDGVLPARLAIIHPRHRSPVAAGVPVFVIVSVLIGLCLAGNIDPLLGLTTASTGIGSVGLMALLALTAFAVPAYFKKAGRLTFATTVAPILGGVLITIGTYLSMDKLHALTGVENGVINGLPWLLLVVMIIGIGQALWLRARAPAVFHRIGMHRLEDDSPV